ncbi:MAG: phospholipase D family protein [Bacillaceae bacterium]|nr:phospholipase D family protein [Bacillaceae bacterium]
MKKIILSALLVFVVFIAGYTLYGLFKPIPMGLSYEGEMHRVANVEFLYDLTFEQDNEIVQERQIVERVKNMIKEAEDFIVFDMFLFNDKYDEDKNYPEITDEITKALLEKKDQAPNIEITFITDEINTSYRSHPSKHLKTLEENGVDVIITNLTPLRDSNPIYSGFWRAFLKTFEREGEGWITNPFSEDAPKVTLGSYLKMLNLKGNHRKVIGTDKEVMVTSANLHDASGFHSNIAFVVSGNIINDFLASEQAVANFSSSKQLPSYDDLEVETGEIRVQLLTEGQTKEHLIEEINHTNHGDVIHVGMFNLSESKVVSSLISAANRGVQVNLILDPNEEIFGNENIGIPNRPVAADIEEYGNGNIQIRWYNTHDEQYHSKLILIERQESSTIIGGSANFTRRNLDDFNLDTSLRIVAPKDSEIITVVSNYFTTLWNNENGTFTVHSNEYLEDFPYYKRLLFRIQKKTGLTTF